MLRKLLTLGLTMVALGGVLVATESPASASYADCPASTLCAWKDKNGTGTRYSWGGNWRNTCWNVAPSQNDNISSVYNRLSVDVQFYAGSNCQSALDNFRVKPGVAATYGQSPFPLLENDQISSIRFH